MLPENRASSTPVSGRFAPPDWSLLNDLHDFELGGVALNDPSQGLEVQTWECFYREADVVVKPASGPETVLFSTPRITALSFAFDQNMRPIVAFEQEDQVWLWWWDTLTSTRRTDSFGVGRCPRLTLDDKRASQYANSDLVFAYIRDTSLCYRQQRDRFTVERVLRTNVSPMSRLKNVAMTLNWRLKFELV
jgi:hypothetical protein